MSSKLSKAIKWSFLTEVASKLIRPVTFLVLGRFLLPEDFGVMAAAMMVIAFSQVFWEAGMSKAIIQRKRNLSTAASTAFWINISFAIIIFSLIWIFSNSIALTLFQNGNVGPVLRAMCFYILLVSLCAVHVAMMQREMDFEKLFWIRLISFGAPAFISVPLAIYGWGYWALIYSTIIGELANLIIIWSYSKWRPRFIFSVRIARELAGFGGWVSLSALLAWFYLWGDSLFVGLYLTGHDLGIYRYGTMAIASIFSVLAGPVLPVVYSYLSDEFRKHTARNSIISKVLLGERIMASGLFTATLFIFYFADFFVLTLLGNEWADLTEIIALIALSSSIAFTVSLKQEAYRAFGRPDVETKIMSISLLVRVLFYMFSVQHGLIVFLYARLVSTVIGVFNHLTFARVILNLPYYEYFRQNGRVLALFLLFMLLGSNSYLDSFSTYTKDFILIFLFASYLTVLILVEFKIIKNLYNAIRSQDAEKSSSKTMEALDHQN